MSVPFLDLQAQYRAIRQEVDAAMAGVVSSCRFVGGPELEAFEREFAEYCEAPYCVGCANGTAALHLALAALGVGPGDEVITAANTFTATAEAIVHAGGVPVFVDVDEASRNLDPALLDEAVSDKTRAILPVHLHGQCADMDPILAAGARHGVPVIEDAAQAHGARYRGRRAGSLAAVACFSFYPGKNLGAYGDAGAVTTADGETRERLKMLADHGRKGKYTHEVVGYNYRLDALQAAVLRVKLRRLDDWNARRRQVAAWYRERLAGKQQVVLQEPMPYAEHVYHHLVVRVADRDGVMQRLAEKGVSTVIHYPVALHRQPAYRGLCRVAGRLSVTEKLASEILSLPMFPEMTEAQVDEVVSALCTAVG